MTARGSAGGLALVAAAAAGVVVGCGTSTPATTPPRTVTTTKTEQSAPPKSGPLHITRPKDGAIQQAHRSGNRLLATLTLRGTASPGTVVYASADCRDPDCEQIVRATSGGHWVIRAQIGVPVRDPKLRIYVGYTDPASGQPAKLLRLTLKAHKVATKPKKSHAKTKHHTTTSTDTTPSDTTTDTTPTTPTTPSGKRPVVVIGDSLAVGTKQALAADLSDFKVTTYARTGRALSEGMAVFATTAIANPRTIVAFSLFTNDEPTNVAALAQAIRFSATRVGPEGCAIWATIVRPPVDGHTYDAANAELVRLGSQSHGQVIVVPWAQIVDRHPSLLGPDGVHATPAGYARRAELYAEAVRSCKR